MEKYFIKKVIGTNSTAYWACHDWYLQHPKFNHLGINVNATYKKEEVRIFKSYEKAEQFLNQHLTADEWEIKSVKLIVDKQNTIV